jgi:hypothetical protein
MRSLTRTLLIAIFPIFIGCDAAIKRGNISGTLVSGGLIDSAKQKNSQFREVPFELQISRKGLCGEWLNSDFPRRFKMSVLTNQEALSSSLSLHLVSAFGSEISTRNKEGVEEKLLDLVLDQDRAIEVFGHPTLFESAFGIRPYARPEAGRGSQTHHDQLLCCLAQVGVGPSVHCKVNGRDRTVADLLSDSVADFYISKKELAFTAIAYAHLLPPRQSWTNKFGEEVSFSDVVDELLSRDIGDSHCFGTHLFEAMIVISRVDREYGPILSPARRESLDDRIKELTINALDQQLADGSWGSQWFKPASLRSGYDDGKVLDQQSKLLVSGHLIQMLAKLSEQPQIEDYVFQKGVRWLDIVTSQLGDEDIKKGFCPCSHAAWCLNHFGALQEPVGRTSVKEVSL